MTGFLDRYEYISLFLSLRSPNMRALPRQICTRGLERYICERITCCPRPGNRIDEPRVIRACGHATAGDTLCVIHRQPSSSCRSPLSGRPLHTRALAVIAKPGKSSSHRVSAFVNVLYTPCRRRREPRFDLERRHTWQPMHLRRSICPGGRFLGAALCRRITGRFFHINLRPYPN